jgi:hypothetical protein
LDSIRSYTKGEGSEILYLQFRIKCTILLPAAEVDTAILHNSFTPSAQRGQNEKPINFSSAVAVFFQKPHTVSETQTSTGLLKSTNTVLVFTLVARRETGSGFDLHRRNTTPSD